MEQKVNVWKATLKYSIILGMIGIIYTLLRYYSDLTINGIIFNVFQFALLVYFLKSYRDNYCFGNITFVQSLGAGVIIFLYYAIIIVIFKYLLFEVIDTGLMDKKIAIYEKSLIEKELPQDTIKQYLIFYRESEQPNIRNSIIEILAKLIHGTIVSLAASIFIKINLSKLRFSNKNNT